ncbi:MAG TPA: hypothetical protein VIV12_26750, partial [Streptosporangiaceae bacterium]
MKPRTPQLEAGITYKKPSFDTILKASRGDKAALAQVRRHELHLRAVKQAAAQTNQLVSGQFGGFEQIAARANKVVNPVASAVIQSISPYTAAKEAGVALQHHNLPAAGLAAMGIFPFGRGARAGRAIKRGLTAEKAATRAVPRAARTVIKKPPAENVAETKLWHEYLALANRDTPLDRDMYARLQALEKRFTRERTPKEISAEEQRYAKAVPTPRAAPKAVPAPNPAPRPAPIQRVAPGAPEEEVLRSTGAARRQYAEQAKLRSAERGRRAGQLGPAFEQAGGGLAGHQAALSQLKGELPTVRFDRLTHLDSATMDQLLNTVQKTDLLPLEKTSLREALIRVQAGRVPRPFEIKLIERAFGPEKAAEAASLRLVNRLAHGIAEVVNVPRALQASIDVSGVMRQALVMVAHNPRLVASQLGPMFRALVSEKYYQQGIQHLIRTDPDYERFSRAGVKFTDISEPLGLREEPFQSHLAEKITGLGPLFGKPAGTISPIRASNRAYTGLLNLLRLHAAKKLALDYGEEAAAQGITQAELDDGIAKFVNWATGRGGLGPLEKSAVPLNTVFFAPRLFASRVQTINPQFYYSLPKPIRMEALKATFRLVAGGTTILGLAALVGAKVNTDPRNADFGKLRVGNTRFDIWGGHQQLARLIAQVQQGKIVSSTTGKTLALKGGYGGMSRQDIIKRFFEGKLAPTPSLINDWTRGTDFADKPFSVKRAVVSRSYPLIIQDALDIYHGTGSPWLALGGYGIGAFGVGIQTYGPQQPSKASGTD